MEEALSKGLFVAQVGFAFQNFGPAYVLCSKEESEKPKEIACFAQKEFHVSVELKRIKVFYPKKDKKDNEK